MSRSKISIFLKNIRSVYEVLYTAVYSLFSEWFPRDEEDILVTMTENGVYAGIVIYYDVRTTY